MGDPQAYVDVVDEHDVVVDTVPRADMRKDRLRHRGTFVAVVTSDAQLVIHQRAPDKDIWPSRWDIGAGGVVDAGEGYEESAARELAEELGIEVDPSGLTEIGRGYFEDDDVALFGRIYALVHDGPFRCTDGEIVAIELVTLAELDRVIPEREWCSDSLEMALDPVRAFLAARTPPIP
jgi:8-oxo-dGTP pyrophosphatase MutT (NUDIX family)